MPRNLTQDQEKLSPNLSELRSVLPLIRSSTPSAQPSTQAPNQVDDMAIPSASFHTTGNGETTSSSQAPNLPPNATQEEIEQVLKRLLEDATVSLHDFTKARLDV